MGERILEVADERYHVVAAVGEEGVKAYREVSGRNVIDCKVEFLAIEHVRELSVGLLHVFSNGGEQLVESTLS